MTDGFAKTARAMNEIFVFGSNLAGIHGKGAALFARKHFGAVYGVGQGHTGNAYAIPTKDGQLRSLSLDYISVYVVTFLEYALAHPELTFRLTAIGCGLAGYRPEQIAPMFDTPLPRNVVPPEEFLPWLMNGTNI